MLEFYRQAEDSPMGSERAPSVAPGRSTSDAMSSSKAEHGVSMLDIAHAITTLLLDWRGDPFRITRPSRRDLRTARELWNTVAMAAVRQEARPV